MLVINYRIFVSDRKQFFMVLIDLFLQNFDKIAQYYLYNSSFYKVIYFKNNKLIE